MNRVGPFATESEWLDWRRTGIGGSDAAAICGLSDFKRPLDVFMDKLNLSEPSNSEAMLWGRRLEPLVAQRFEELSGFKTIPGLYLQSSSHPFMLASVDRGIEGESSGLEVKTAGGFSRKDWGVAGSDQIPHDYNIQCQHTMAVAEWDVMHVAVLLSGNDFRYFRINRNEQLIRDLIAVESRFWDRVLTKEPPDETDPAKVQAYIKALWPESEDRTVIATEDIDRVVSLFADANTKLKQCAYEALALKNKITMFMGDAAILEGDGYRITYKSSAGRRTIDWDSVAIEQRIPAEVIDRFTTVGKPARRFLMKTEKEETANV